MMHRFFLLALSAMALACVALTPAAAQQTEPRIAFVVGNAAYGPGPLPSALNDAGLVAEALRSIGFEVVEGADLNQPDLVRSFRDFLGKVQAAGPDTLAVVYFSGHAISFEGENFLLGVDARIARDSDIPIQGVRLSDLLRPLGDTQARAKVMIIDAARESPFQLQGRPPGLEAVEPPQGMLVAFSSAPGTVAPDRPGNYGAYATAIAEMLRAPGTDLDVAFTHIRSRTHLATEGQQTPWHLSAIGEQIELVPAEAAQTAGIAAPPPPRPARRMREVEPDEAYSQAIEMDTLDGYVDFVEAYPQHPYSERVWAMIRARREALAWMRALQYNSPQAYWTYLRRYPDGLYAYDAERRLRRLGAPFDPPQGFAMMAFDGVPMALVDEPRDYRAVYRVGPPPPRILYRAPPPAFLVSLPPPRRMDRGVRVLPALGTTMIPAIARLTPAPRRDGPPGAGRPSSGGWQGGFAARPQVTTTNPAPGAIRPPGGWRPGGAPPPGAAAPAAAAPSAAIAPSTVTPNTVTPNTVTPGARPGGRPPGWGSAPNAPGAGAPGTPRTYPQRGVNPNTAVAPSTVTPNTAAPTTAAPAPSTAPGNPQIRRNNWQGGTANRTPPQAAPSVTPPAQPQVRTPPPAAVARPTPPQAPVVRQAPPPPVVRAAPPPPPVQRAAPPPPPPQRQAAPAPPPPRPAAPPPAAAAKPPACPAGKSFVNGACR
jgi:hypothetical protein